jgi:V8-like Glu-specific endopeptidase
MPAQALGSLSSSSSSARRRDFLSAAARLETLEVRRLLAAAVWDIDSPDVPHDKRGRIVGNYVHELEHATGRQRLVSLADSDAGDAVLNQSLKRAGFNGMADLVNSLGDAKTFEQRLEDARDDQGGFNSVFGPDDRFQIFAGTSFPWRSVVRIGSNDANYRGTGALIDPYHVLTAGHVVHSGAGGNWISTLQCTPGQTDVNSRPYGTAEWTYVRSYTNWTNSSDANWDWAVITLDRRVGNFTGWMGTEWNGNTNAYNGTTVNLAGYPSDKAIGTMWGASGPINNGNGGQQFFYNGTLDTAPGHSGSPVWRFDGTNRYIVGVHAYGDNGDGFNKATRMTQQKFNDTWAWAGEDNNIRPPTDRSDLLDYDDWFNTNTSSVSPGTVQQGGGINISFNARNNGTANANNAAIRFYASTDANITGGDIYLGERVVNVGAIGTLNVGFNGTIPASTPVGTYYIGWIMDATNTNAEYLENNNTGSHNTTIQVTQALQPDFFEPNDTFAAARNLGTLRDATHNGLNIHATGNDDYYRFTAGATGTLNLSIAFTHSLGDIDMALLNSAGSVLASSTGTTNSEFISWSLTRGTTYGIRVYGYQGATNPSYSMTLAGPDVPADGYEANDDFGSPAQLGAITSFAANDLTIHASGNADFYRFVTPGSGAASINMAFQHIDGDVDMALYSDTGTFIASSTGTSNSEHINFNATGGSAYVLQTYGYAGALNWKYDLVILAQADNIAPTVTSDQFQFETAPQELRFAFSEDVSASLSPSDLILQDLTHGTTVPPSSIHVSYDFGNNTAIFTFPGFANGVLPQARYSAKLVAGSIQDAWGNPLAADYIKTFRFLAGDANGDGRVNFDDYVRIDNGFNNHLTGFSNGDFNYDGVIDFDDYVLIDLSFNTQ